MIHRIPFIVLLAGLAVAQSPSVPCCNCESPRRSDDVICISAKEMRDHVDQIEPLKPSGLGKGLNLAGIIVVEMRFEPNGKVACVRAKSGHPIAISAAMEAVRKWNFKPLRLNGAAKGACGDITIKYRLRDKGSSTELR
jgi:hypothetical protein